MNGKKSNDSEDLEILLKSYSKEINKHSPSKEIIQNFVDQIKKGEYSIQDAINSINDTVSMNKTQKFLKNFPTFKTQYSSNEIKNLMNDLSEDSAALSKSGWYHSFKFGEVEIINDVRTGANFQMWAAQGIPENLKNKSILDVGAADGFYSFLCEHRGAKRVLAVDYDNYAGFNVAKKILDSKVEKRIMNAENIDQLDESFDIGICFGLYYHLANPVLVLEKLFSKINDTLFLAGHIIDNEAPIMCLYDEYGLHPHDPSNWWVASPSCLLLMAKRIGFKNCEMIDVIKEYNPFQSKELGLEKVYGLGLFKFSK